MPSKLLSEYTPDASIVISSKNRLPLFRRVLYAISERPPSIPWELVVVDDNSDEDILGELQTFSPRIPWVFVEFDAKKFEELSGLKQQWGNPCCTNNLGVHFAQGEWIFQQGNEVIPWGPVYDCLITDFDLLDTELGIVFSTTYDVPKQILNLFDKYGQNILEAYVRQCERWPLQSENYRSDVTNYISLTTKTLWNTIRGYDERYFAGISAEDSDFVRRARKIEGFQSTISKGVSLHQYHSGKTAYYDPPPNVITKQKWDELVAINHKIYHAWDSNPLCLPAQKLSTQCVKNITSNFRKFEL